MPCTIRPFTPADYEPIAQLVTTVLGHLTTAEELRWEDEQRSPKCKYQCWVAEAGGRVVGVATYSQYEGMFHPRKFDVNVMVDPEYRRQGVGSRLYETVVAALRPYDPISFLCSAREHWAESIRFIEQRGYKERMRNWESHLDLTTADLSAFAPVVEQVAAAGYVIRSYAERQAAGEPDLDRRLHRLGQIIRLDIPSPEPRTDVSFEEWAKRLHSNPMFSPELYMIADKDGEFAGLSNMWNTQEPGLIRTGMTGVLREHRGTGLAKALKVFAIEASRAAGYQRTTTWNASTNVKMLAINEAMGFVRQPAWVSYALELQPDA